MYELMMYFIFIEKNQGTFLLRTLLSQPILFRVKYKVFTTFADKVMTPEELKFKKKQ